MRKPERLIASIQNSPELPTIIYFCCVHGNEKAGYLALQSFFNHLQQHTDLIHGNIYALFGNQEAYLQNVRFIDKDLNRIWTQSHISAANSTTSISEYYELVEMYNTLHAILKSAKNRVYAIDLHTTSGPTKPFIIMNDALNNRAFVRDLGYPVIFNVETFIEGALLNLLNDLGHVSLAFEGGEHYAEKSVEEIQSFCYKTLYHTHLMSAEHLEKIGISKAIYKPKSAKYYEMIFRQALQPQDKFEMCGNYLNFQKLKKGERIAWLNDESIYAPKAYQIFMPLYQNKGEDGFFYVKYISSFKLKVARILRNLKVDEVLTLIPGVEKRNSYTLSIPRDIEKFIPKRFLFALGYRKSLEFDNGKIGYTKQERKLQSLPKLNAFKSPYQDVMKK